MPHDPTETPDVLDSVRSVDCIVLGGGYAGVVAASLLAESGVDVLLFEANERDADASDWPGLVPVDALRDFAPAMLNTDCFSPCGKFVLVSADGTHSSSADEPALVQLRRRDALRAQRLVAEQHGARFLFGASARPGDWQDARRKVHVGDDVYAARVVVDARGYSPLRSSGAVTPEFELSKATVSTHAVQNAAAAQTWLAEVGADAGDAVMFANIEGGHSTLTIIVSEDLRTASVLCSVMCRDDYRPPQDVVQEAIASFPFLGKKLQSSSGLIPLRPLRHSFVSDGLIVVGDAAGTVVPMTGMGVQTALESAAIAADVISESLHRGDCSQDALWDFNVRFQRGTGARIAGQQPFKYTMMTIDNVSAAFLEETGLLRGHTVSAALRGSAPAPGVPTAFHKVLRSRRTLPLITRYMRSFELAARISRHYRNFPTRISGLASWSRKTEQLNASARRLATGTITDGSLLSRIRTL